MRYAIDRYSVGIETEVEADDFDNQYYIPRRHNRFFCPECGEKVYFRAKGGTHPNQFYHQEKNESTPECDKRVDGRSELSLSQRIGLSLFLTGIVSGRYQLSIGFPALGADMLQKVTLAGYTVEISFGNHSNTIRVNQATFIENATTLIPVNFIPTFGDNYAITITGERIVCGIQRKWSDYADGFGIDGAFFTYEETGGKKVRRGDSISTNRYYYVVLKNIFPPYKEIIYSVVGRLDIGGDTYRVLKVIITASVDDKAAFEEISLYLKRHFGVWLLECQPELIPIWPPVVQREFCIPVIRESSVICVVSSGNAEPSVYIYSEYAVKKMDIQHGYDGIGTIELLLGSRPIVLSVDRKYVGREMTFSNAVIPPSDYSYEINIKDETDEIIPFEELDKKKLSSTLSVVSNSKMELYIGTEDKMFRHVPIRDSITAIPTMELLNSLYMFVESGVIKKWEYSSENKVGLNTICTERIINSKKGNMVPVPRWADYIIKKFRNDGRKELYKAVMTTVSNGRIYADTLKQLRLFELGNPKDVYER